MIEAGKVYSSNNCGDFVVISYDSCKHIKVRFLSTGRIKITKSTQITSGEVKDEYARNVYGVGFVGVGNYRSTIKGCRVKSYSAWYEMMRRCYSEKFHIANPTYKDCIVCDEWQNLQVFAKWYDESHPANDKSYALDKDIKLTGNKVYSPVNCMFVDKSVNSKQAVGTLGKSWLIRGATGVLNYITSQSKFVKENKINKGNFASMLRGERKTCRGFTLVDTHDKSS